MSVVNFIANYVLGTPAILLAFIALVGLILQKKSFSDIVAGALKTAIGYLILDTGVGVLVSSIDPMGAIINEGLGLQGFFADDTVATGAGMAEYGSMAVLVMLIAFVVNLIVARITPFKYVFLTGHIFLYNAVFITILLREAMGMPAGIWVVLVGGVLLGILHPLEIALVQPYMDKLTNNAGIGYAHCTNVTSWLGGFIGEKFGNKEHSTEDLKLPKWASMFRDSTLACGIFMFLIMFVVSLIAGSSIYTELAGEQGVFIWSLMIGLKFGAGVSVLLMGVRMLVTELVPAFTGFSEKLVPNAKPGLDCPVVMTYAPTAWLLGFLISFPIGIVITLLQAGLLNYQFVVVTGVIIHFFGAGPAAVFGNSTGGIRGAVLASVAYAIIVGFGAPLLINLCGTVMQGQGVVYGCSDYTLWGPILGYLFRGIGALFGWV